MLNTSKIQRNPQTSPVNPSLCIDYPELLAKPHKISTKPEKPVKAQPGLSPVLQRIGRPHKDTKYNTNKAKWEAVLSAGATLSCTVGYIGGQCSGGHQFLKVIYCGREWCHNCGEDGSPAHQRRIARWLPKIAQMDSVGYLVVTIPKIIREGFNDRKRLSDFRTFVKRKLQRLGYSRGLIRYHVFGDCPECNGHGCANCHKTGSGRDYNPHLNILIDEGYLDQAGWDRLVLPLKKSVEGYFRKHFKSYPKKDLAGNVFYSYASDKAHIMHKLKYITRATFRIFNEKYAETWQGFRVSSTWGKWDKTVNPPKDDLALLENGFCPYCIAENKGRQTIKWFPGYYETDTETGEMKWIRGIVSRKDFEQLGYHIKHIKAGYYGISPEIKEEFGKRVFHFNQLELFPQSPIKDKDGFLIT